jgi:hypothetical protein
VYLLFAIRSSVTWRCVWSLVMAPTLPDAKLGP